CYVITCRTWNAPLRFSPSLLSPRCLSYWWLGPPARRQP
ncbi:MAG: hypothetical protein AVDCRST_MAG04-3280, partial [uncultured Acetobacteraceae bacterium]